MITKHAPIPVGIILTVDDDDEKLEGKKRWPFLRLSFWYDLDIMTFEILEMYGYNIREGSNLAWAIQF